MPHNTFNTLDSLDLGDGRRGQFSSLPKLEAAGVGNVSKLPVSIRIVLESVLRNVDGKKIAENDVRTLANWQASVRTSFSAIFLPSTLRRTDSRTMRIETGSFDTLPTPAASSLGSEENCPRRPSPRSRESRVLKVL